MKYLQVDIKLNRLGIELFTTKLLEFGITDFAVNDPQDIKEILSKTHSYDWDYIDNNLLVDNDVEPILTIYFNDEQNDLQLKKIESITETLKKMTENEEFGYNIDLGSLDVSYSIVDDNDWKNNWKEYFKPTKVSGKIVVKPTWENYNVVEDEKVIEIDPGMAFGTGTHETTSLCIKMLEKYMNSNDKVLDVGTGSGILSIAAALLGAKEVLAVDIDPIAVDVAKENITLNKLENTIKSQYGDLAKGIDFKANVIVANLMADLVMILSEDANKHLLPNGFFISSGILVEKENEVQNAIEKAGFRVVEIVKDGMWEAIVATPK